MFRVNGTSTPRVHSHSSAASTSRAAGGSTKALAANTQPATAAAAAQDAAASSSTRRGLLVGAGMAATIIPMQALAVNGDWSSPGLAAAPDESMPAFFKTARGAKVQELKVGSGPVAQQNDAVLVDFVLRRNNGYFIYGTIEGVSFQPSDVPVGPIRLQLGSGEVIEGLESAIVGMKQGGKRRVLVPPEVGYVSNVLQPQMPTFATKRQLANHSSEPLLFEVELLRVLHS